MKFLSGRIILLGFILNILVVALMAWAAIMRDHLSQKGEQDAATTNKVTSAVQKIHFLNYRLQNDAKGYAITGDESYIAEMQWTVFNLAKSLEDLRVLIHPSPSQLIKFQALEAGIEKKTQEHTRLTEVVKYRNYAEARTIFISHENIRQNTLIDRLTTGIQGEEEELFANNQKYRDYYRKFLSAIFFISLILALLSLVAVFLILMRYLKNERIQRKLLAESMQLVKSVIDNSGNLVYVKEISGQYKLANKQFNALFEDREIKDAVGKTDRELFTPETAEKRLASDLSVLRSESAMRFEETLFLKGEPRTFLTTKFPIKDLDGHSYAIGGISIDISEHAKDDLLMKEREEQINKMFEAAPDAVILIDEESRILRWNRMAEQMFKWKADEVVGKFIYDTIMPEKYKQQHIDGMKRFLQTGEGPILSKVIELSAIDKDGTEIIIELKVSPTHNDKYIFIAFIRDITERKKLEQENQQNKNFLSSVVENMPDMLIAKDAKTLRIIQCNKATEKLLGYSRQELIGKTDFELYPQAQAERSATTDRQALEQKTLVDIPEEMAETRNGNHWLHTRKIIVPNETGEPAFILSLSEDITAKKKLEDEKEAVYKQLDESKKQIASILENIGDAVIATDDKLLISFMNPVAEKLTGWQEQDAKGKPIERIFSIINEKTRERVENPIIQAIAEKHVVSLSKDTLLIRKDNTEIHIDDTGSPILNEQGEIIGAVLIFRDITAEIMAERELEASIKRFSQILNFTPIAISISEQAEGKFLYVNDAFCDKLGFSREELIGKKSYELNILTEQQRKVLLERGISQGGHPKDVETTIRRKNGDFLNVLYSAEQIIINKQTCLVVAFVDITERKNMEQRVAMILENIDEGVLLTDPNYNVLLSNRMADEILGIRGLRYSPNWAQQYNIYNADGVTPFPREKLPVEQTLRGETIRNLEIILEDPENHRKILLLASGQPILDEENRLLAALVTLKDITRLRETERDLEETELKYRKLIGFGRNTPPEN